MLKVSGAAIPGNRAVLKGTALFSLSLPPQPCVHIRYTLGWHAALETTLAGTSILITAKLLN